MLSDEEKEILNNIKEYMQNDIDKGYHKFVYNDLGSDFKCIDCINAIDNVLNLIEKQTKEIEELNKSDESKEQSSMKYYNLYKELVDKIKAKIEEVEQWELYNMKIPRLSTLDERLGAKIGIKYVLQSLLEKE